MQIWLALSLRLFFPITIPRTVVALFLSGPSLGPRWNPAAFWYIESLRMVGVCNHIPARKVTRGGLILLALRFTLSSLSSFPSKKQSLFCSRKLAFFTSPSFSCPSMLTFSPISFSLPSVLCHLQNPAWLISSGETARHCVGWPWRVG